MPGFKIIENPADSQRLSLVGVIDDLADFSPILAKKEPIIHLDLDQISELNSYGVKIWSQFLIQMKGRLLIYHNCRPVIIRQMSVVLNLRKNVKVDSFYAPFECNSCLIEKEILCKTDNLHVMGLDQYTETTVTNVSCSRCAGTMDFMEDESTYFKFLSSSLELYANQQPHSA